MKKQDKSKRVMTLPQPSFWNWLYYRWGMRGSGFIWYGIAQPMLERPFDPWSSYNEQYFNEVFYALQKENSLALTQIIRKYDISFILIDGYFHQTDKVQEQEKQQIFIEKTFPGIEKVSFGKIVIYKLPQRDFISVEKKLTPAYPSSPYTSFDTTYADSHGYYQSSEDWKVVYPFSTVFTNKTQTEIPFRLTTTSDSIVIHQIKPIPISNLKNNLTLEIPIKDQVQQLLPVKIILEKKSLLIIPYAVDILISKKKTLVPFANEISINLGNTSISKIKLNGEEVQLNSNNYYIAYLKAPNQIWIQSNLKTESIFSFSLQQADIFHLPFKNVDVDISVSIPKIFPQSWKSSSILENMTYEINTPCSEVVTSGEALSFINPEGITLRSQGTDACVHQYVSDVSQNLGIVALINTSNKLGLDYRLIVDNPQQKTNIIDTKLNAKNNLNIITIPPTSNYLYFDYGFHLRNTSPGNSVSENTFKSFEVYYFPYVFLQNIKIKTDQKFEESQEILDQNHPYVYYYSIHVPSDTSGFLKLSQSYSDSWKAYEMDGKPNWIQVNFPFLFGKEIKEHVLINNWANGWALRPSDTTGSAPQGRNIVIVFLPQYLQFIGFGLLIATFVGIFFWKERRNN
jgi:hypothetical protein